MIKDGNNRGDFMCRVLEGIKKFINRMEGKKWFVIMCFFILFFSVLFWETLQDKIPNYATHVANQDNEQFIHDIREGMLIEQTFSSLHDFDFITLSFSDHDQYIEGTTIISLSEYDTGKIVYYEEIPSGEIKYLTPVEVHPEGGGKRGVKYLLDIQARNTTETALGLFGYNSNENAAILNGKTLEYTVSIGIHSYTMVYQRLFLLVYIILIISLLFITFWVMVPGMKIEFLFLGTVIPVGILFLLFLSSNVVHDGNTHLAKVYHYSNVILGNAQHDQYGIVELSEAEADVFYEVRRGLDTKRNSALYEYYAACEKFSIKTNYEESWVSCDYRETSASSVLEYMPAVITVTLGRLFNVSVYFNLLMAKIVSFLFYIGLCFWAIRNAPYLKTGIAFAALIPMNLYQATGITYDSTVCACSLLLFSYILKACKEKIIIGDIVITSILSLIIGCCKGGFYLPILLLWLWVLRKGENKEWKKIFIWNCILGGVGFAFTAFDAFWPYIRDAFSLVSTETAENALVTVRETVPSTESDSYGILYCVAYPKGFIVLLINTLIEKLNFYVGGAIGYRMAWAYRSVDFLIVVPFLVILILSISKTEGDAEIRPAFFQRLICCIIVCLEFLGFHVLMLVETPVDLNVIQGVQGRYFLPLIPIIALALYDNGRIQTVRSMRRLFMYYAFAIAFYFYTFVKVFIGY